MPVVLLAGATLKRCERVNGNWGAGPDDHLVHFGRVGGRMCTDRHRSIAGPFLFGVDARTPESSACSLVTGHTQEAGFLRQFVCCSTCSWLFGRLLVLPSSTVQQNQRFAHVHSYAAAPKSYFSLLAVCLLSSVRNCF